MDNPNSLSAALIDGLFQFVYAHLARKGRRTQSDQTASNQSSLFSKQYFMTQPERAAAESMEKFFSLRLCQI